MFVLASVASAAFAQSASLPSDLDAKSLARLPYVTRQDLGDAGQKLADIFARNGKPSDPITGPLAFASYNVPVANALLDLHDGAVGKGSLNPHVRELAILVACRETNYNLEWNGHEPAAVKAGVDAKAIDAVRTGGALTGLGRRRRGSHPLRPRADRRPQDELRHVREGRAAVRQERRDGPRRRDEHVCRERLLRDCGRRASAGGQAGSAGAQEISARRVSEQHADIRDAVARLCEDFPGGIGASSTVAARIRGVRRGARGRRLLVDADPEQYGGSGLGVGAACAVLEEIQQERLQRRRVPRADVHDGHAVEARQRGAEEALFAADRGGRAAAAGVRRHGADERHGHDAHPHDGACATATSTASAARRCSSRAPSTRT